ncbi:DCN1-like protein 4 [Carex littledalei]|uniref:Defective in cullin neddylation protein n=1 Tax=Carex littledalei TaxID=544730 RepID=A0A833VWZ5_9POAL|nr:DCN1-like protein 4 [Carex littledalei]
MRRSSNRKSSSASATAGSTKAASKEFEKIDQLFNVYVDKSSGTIDPEGIEQLCSSLEVDYTDVRILMLAWKMRAQKQGYFTLEEWRTGLKALRVDSISKLKKTLPELAKEVSRPSDFLDFYSYAFRYCLTGTVFSLPIIIIIIFEFQHFEIFWLIPEDKQKCIDIESACQLLSLVLGSQFGPQVDKFIEYLKNQSEYKVINMDQWMGFYRFCHEIPFPSLENYDSDLAWPLILDNFVEWFRENQK